MSPEPVLPVEDPSVDYASFAASMVGTSLPDSEVDGLGMGGLTGGMVALGLGLEGRKSPRSGPGSQDEVTSSLSKLPFGASTRQRTPSSSDSSPPSLNSSVAWNMPGGAASASGRLSRGTSPSFPSPSKGDCIILSEDGMLFRVYRAELWKSAPLLEDVSMGVRIKQGMGNDIASNVLPVEESGTTVETLLGWIIVGGKVEERKPEELGGAIKAAREWGCDRDVIDTMKETIVCVISCDGQDSSRCFKPIHPRRLSPRLTPTLPCISSHRFFFNRNSTVHPRVNTPSPLFFLHLSSRVERALVPTRTPLRPLTGHPLHPSLQHPDRRNSPSQRVQEPGTPRVVLGKDADCFAWSTRCSV
ncbi:hypothetical protein BT69DRAFT_509668 [Atractiella rhizophila]|nr:hypothetical protein BT69DRAFT_509668 [Atractiella rhizophila]